MSAGAGPGGPRRPERLGLVIGAMKSGTTSLFDILCQHPEICGARWKEPSYFIKGFVDKPDWQADDAWYLGLFEGYDPARHKVLLEASTRYTMAPRWQGAPAEAARFAAAWGTELRLVYLMRHPIARIESQLRHVAERAPRDLLFDRRSVLAHALAISSYATQLAPWVATFGRERLLLVSFEELTQRSAPTLARIAAHLGVDPGFRFVDTDAARNPSDRARPTMSLLRQARWFGPLWRRLPVALRQRLKALARPVTERRGSLLTAAERREAEQRVWPEVERLAREHGFDPSVWRRA